MSHKNPKSLVPGSFHKTRDGEKAFIMARFIGFLHGTTGAPNIRLFYSTCNQYGSTRHACDQNGRTFPAEGASTNQELDEYTNLLLPCPFCGRSPKLLYACGDYWVNCRYGCASGRITSITWLKNGNVRVRLNMLIQVLDKAEPEKS